MRGLISAVAIPALLVVLPPREPSPDVGAQSPTPPSRQQAPASEAAAVRSARNANYSIDARLDPATRTITGREILTWRNIASIPTSELRFHLYYNAWRNTRSTWMRERLLSGRSTLRSRPESDWSWIDVTAIRLVGAGPAPPIDLSHQATFSAPDDGNPDDQTVLAVPLPMEVVPGQTINVEIEWTSRVPRTFARTGAIGDFFFIAQWFPKIGVLEAGGWNCHQFHSATEFFADYGIYDVRLTLPTGWVAGATGLERERRDNPEGTTTHRYYQEDVHDFAWTTSPQYLEFKERFEHGSLPPVAMRLLLQPEHEGQQRRHFEATRAALRYYGEWFGAYPYGHITIVDPAWQSGAGGMEYPTLFTAGTDWLTAQHGLTPESVTVHEAGHQFWYGLVGNNEFEHAWLDEGLNTFSTARVLEVALMPRYRVLSLFGGFAPYPLRDVPWSREGDRVTGYRSAARMDDQSTSTYLYWPGTASSITYNKTAIWLHTLERHLGWPVLQRGMSTFFQRWMFKHPKPDDFFAAINEASGQDLTWFFDQVHRDSVVFDYGIQELSSREVGGRGFFTSDQPDPSSSQPDAGAALAGRSRPRFTDDSDDRARFETTVVVRRHGEGVFPVDVLVEFADGAVIREIWDGKARWKAFAFERPARAARAVVDPDRVLLLDTHYTNNSRTLRPRSDEAATKWMLKWIVWFQDLLLTYGYFV